MQIKSAKDLIVYQRAYTLAMEIFEGTRKFPCRGEVFFDRSNPVFLSLGLYELREAWAKRRYEAHFVSKLTDADGENRETDTWLDFACDCLYLPKTQHASLSQKCAEVGAMLGGMINDPSSFILKPTSDL